MRAKWTNHALSLNIYLIRFWPELIWWYDKPKKVNFSKLFSIIFFFCKNFITKNFGASEILSHCKEIKHLVYKKLV